MRREIEVLKELNAIDKINIDILQKEVKEIKEQLVDLRKVIDNKPENLELKTTTVQNKNVNLKIPPKENLIQNFSVNNKTKKIMEKAVIKKEKTIILSDVESENLKNKTRTPKDPPNLLKDNFKAVPLESRHQNLNKENFIIKIDNSSNTRKSIVLPTRKIPIPVILSIANNYSFNWAVFLEGTCKNPVGVKKEIVSPPFYSGETGYLMKLMVRPSETFLSIGFVIIKGQFDDYLSWPMQRDVIISIIDQITNEPFLSVTLKPVYDMSIYRKPNDIWNSPRINEKFMKLNSIFNNGRLCKQNFVIVRSSVNGG